jgi:hypothetical protein
MRGFLVLEPVGNASKVARLAQVKLRGIALLARKEPIFLKARASQNAQEICWLLMKH